jgi:hypothetical protein
MMLGVLLSPIIERHFTLSVKLTAYIVYMIASCLVPAVLLALGALVRHEAGSIARESKRLRETRISG